MRRILLVKTSAMGDVVHNLPVVGDILGAFPDAEIDWVVEENFAAIPRLHPRVREVIPSAVRRWRRRLVDSATWREIAGFRDRVTRTRYDAVLDTQGLLKSAVMARMSRGPRHGFDWESSREPLRPFYDRTYSIPWSLHAVERNRLLASKALGYELPAHFDSGIAARPGDLASLQRQLPAGATERPYAVLLHATSAAAKEWPEANWVALGRRLMEKGVASVLPFGSIPERARSERLAAQIPRALVPPVLELDLLAALLSRARFVVGVDTGVSHLAVALRRPTIGIYCATDPAATGLYGGGRVANLGGIGLAPKVEDVLAALQQVGELFF